MRNFDILDITKSLLGEAVAQGAEHLDGDIYDNLDDYERLLYYVIAELSHNSRRVDAYQASVHRIAHKSYSILKEAKCMIDDEIRISKQKLFKDDHDAVKYKNLTSPLHIYQIVDTDTIISPFNIEYTLEWYNNELEEHYTNDDIKELILFYDIPDVHKGTISKPKYQPDDKQILYWDLSTPEEIKYLGTNMSVQPNASKLGTIKNFYGDIYTQRNFYDALIKYKDITEPEILCSKEW